LLAQWSVRQKLNYVSSVQLRRSVRVFTLITSMVGLLTFMIAYKMHRYKRKYNLQQS